jgi:lysozyme
MRKINTSGINLIRSFEGCRLDAYLDTGNVPTVGWGHTRGVRMGQTITQEQADAFLVDDLAGAEEVVERWVKVPLTDNQYAALVSFTFNCGAAALFKSTLLRKLNAGDYAGASDEFLRWDKDNGKTVRGLTKRRAMERALFLKGE